MNIVEEMTAPATSPTLAGMSRSIPSPDQMRTTAEELYQHQAWHEAGQIYQKLIHLLPDDPAVWRRSWECSQRQGHELLAEFTLDEALTAHPEWEEFFKAPLPEISALPAAPEKPRTTTRRKSCVHIEGGLAIMPTELKVCCYKNGMRGQPNITKYEGGAFPLDKILAKRAEIREANHTGVYEACRGCFFLQEADWPDHPAHLFTHLDVVTSAICQLRCYYCYTVRDPDSVVQSKYDPYEVFAALVQDNAISPTAWMNWSGGEPTVSKRFEEVLPLLLFGNTSHRILSHCGRPSSAVLQALRLKRAEVICSIDAGTRETYLKVKGRDWFEQVVDTCTQYAATGGNLRLKYICLPENVGRNDLDGFLAVARQLKVRSILLDYNFTLRELPPKEILEALSYLLWQAQLSGIHVEFFAGIMASAAELRVVERIRQEAFRQMQETLKTAPLLGTIASGADASKLTPLNMVSVLPGTEGVLLRSSGNDPYLLLPAMELPDNHRALISLDITAAQNDLLEVYFLAEGMKDFTPQNRVQISLIAGRQQVFLPAFPFAGRIQGRIRLDPGCFAGDYLLHRLDIHAISTSNQQTGLGLPAMPSQDVDTHHQNTPATLSH